MNIIKCPFCLSKDTNKIKTIISEINNKKYTLHNCNSCKLHFFTPLIFEDIYSNEKIWWYKEFHLGRIFYPNWTKKLLDIISKKKIAIKNKKILEVWAWDWINFQAIKNKFNIKNNDYHIVELDNNSVDRCKKLWINNCYNAYFDKNISINIKEKFDIIIITEVFEHQTNPKEFIETVYKLLNKNGYILITVPNRERFFINYRSDIWDSPPHHFLRFNKSFFLKNFYKNIIYLTDYPFKDKNIIDSSKALSKLFFKSNRIWIIFVPFVLFLRILDIIKWEGIICILQF